VLNEADFRHSPGIDRNGADDEGRVLVALRENPRVTFRDLPQARCARSGWQMLVRRAGSEYA
jgi:hypothetical protein